MKHHSSWLGIGGHISWIKEGRKIEGEEGKGKLRLAIYGKRRREGGRRRVECGLAELDKVS